MTRPLQRYATTAWGDDEVVEEVPAPKKNGFEYSLLTKCIAEFLGDFTFVFVGTHFQIFRECDSLGTMQAYVTTNVDTKVIDDNILHAALTHGFAIFLLVAGLGHIRYRLFALAATR